MAAETEATVPVEQNDGELTIQLLQEADAVLLIEMDDHFDVDGGTKAVPAPLQVMPQVAMIVDLTVAEHDDRAVLVFDRLPAAGKIDDGQPAASQA